MATRNFVPRMNGEGNIGKASKNWDKGYFRDLFINGKALQDFVKELGIESSQMLEQTGWIKFGNGALVQWRHAPSNQDFEAPIAFKGFDVGFCTSNSSGIQYAGLVYNRETKKFRIYANTQDARWLYVLMIGRWK